MNAFIRNKSIANRPKDEFVIQLTDILKMSDKSVKDNCFKQFVNHLLLSTDCQSKGCHDLVQVLAQLVSSVAHLQSCDHSMDRLLSELNLIELNDRSIEKKYFELMSETINLKPIKCNQLIQTLIVGKLFAGFRQFEFEKQIQPQEVALFDEMHSALSVIKVAKFETIFLRAIERKFPFFSRMSSTHSYLCYVHNMFKAYDYVNHKHRLLSTLFHQLSDMDSTVSSVKTEITEEVFAIDDCNTSKAETNDDKRVDILDHLMQLVMDFVNKKFANNSREENEELFTILRKILSSEVFPVVSANHLPFIWLYMSSLCNQFMEQLIEYLWDLGLNCETAFDIREKSLYFMSSLLKNANFVTINVVMAFMNMSSLWIHKYIDQNDRVVHQLTPEDQIFYNLCQILFDIFCSIHSDLDNLSLRRVKAMNFQRIIKCLLNPLSVCNQDIESNFLCLARHYQIGYSTQNTDSTDDRLKTPYNPFNNGSYVCPKSMNKMQEICKHLINSDNSFKENQSFNRFNTSDDSDMFGSYKLSYSPSKTLWQNLLSDSSPNEHMDCE